MEIREARRSDWPAIEALVRAAYHPDYIATGEIYLGIEGLIEKLQALREEFDASGSRFLVCMEGERALGAILVRLPQPGRVWIDDIFVAPSARRKGIATELISCAVPPKAEVGCEVNRRNEASLGLFKKLGFERVVENAVFRRRGEE